MNYTILTKMLYQSWLQGAKREGDYLRLTDGLLVDVKVGRDLSVITIK